MITVTITDNDLPTVAFALSASKIVENQLLH
jgi:hypothetical protein